jgi:peptidyl-prolyl cis-trans isomerase D
MLGFFRSFFQSRLGVGITLGFVGLIALAFASADVTGNRFGSNGGGDGDRVARIGHSSIGAGLLTQTVTQALEQQRQKNPGMTMKDIVAQGAIDEVLNDLIERSAMLEWGKKYGFGVGNRLIGSELAQIPAFAGPDGKFNETVYRSVIAQKGFTDAALREDITKGLMAKQLLVPASFGAAAPTEAALRYLSLLKEHRQGTIVLLPSLAFAANAVADDKTLQAFYGTHSRNYLQPERRTLRYFVIDDASLKNVTAPTEAEITKRYTDNKAVYAPSETRSVTQVILPSEAAAKPYLAKAGDLEAAAKANGLAAAKLDKVTRNSLTGQATSAIAEAVFAAQSGAAIGPVKGPLGWYVIHVDAVQKNAGKTLDQARGEITAALAADKRQLALTAQANSVADRLEKGTGLADVAKSLGATVITTEPLLASGVPFGKKDAKPDPTIMPLLQTAFGMEREGQPQLVEIQKGKSVAVFDVGQITRAAPAPFAAVKDAVLRDYRTDRGWTAARDAADKLMAAAAKGTPAADAIKSLGVAIPAPQSIDISREQLIQMGQKVPPPLALMFGMAKGSTKRLEGADKGGWYVVMLKAIVTGPAAPNDPLIGGLKTELGNAMGREYAQQLRIAMRNEIGVTRNATAIDAARTRLVGGQ